MYSQNIYSFYKIEPACKHDINFMKLLYGHKAPKRSMIIRFFIPVFFQMPANISLYQMSNRIQQWKFCIKYITGDSGYPFPKLKNHALFQLTFENVFSIKSDTKFL